jgi:hypothetical protein
MLRHRAHISRLRKFGNVSLCAVAVLVTFSGGFALAACGGSEKAAMSGTSTAAAPGSGRTTEPEDTNGEPAEPEDTNGESTEPKDTNGEPKTAALTFTLDLVGPVPYADRYSVTFSIDGREDVNRFCGFGDASTRCLNSKLYSLEIPSVRLGSNISWYFTRTGVTTFDFAGRENVTFSNGMTIAVRCIYRDTTAERPTCERTS